MITTHELFHADQIDVQARVRYNTDGLDELADSIRKYGLLQPILLDQNNTIQDGWRRYNAIRILMKEDAEKWCMVPVYRRERLTEAEYFEVELETNIRRKDFTWNELVKAVCRVHKTRSREAALTGGSWTMEMTGELLGGFGKSYVWNCLQLEPRLEQEKFIACETITDAVRLMLREKEDAGIAELAKRTQLTRVVAPAILADGTAKTTDDLATQLLAVDTDEVNVDLSSTLFLGDSVRDILPKWPEACVDHIICDPPYGIDVDDLQQATTALIDVERIRDTHSVAENLEMFPHLFKQCHRVLKDGGFLILWCDIMQWQTLYDLAISNSFGVQRWPITWVKTGSCKCQMANVLFTKTTEIALVCRKGNATLPTPVRQCHILASNNNVKISNPFAKPFELWRFLIESVSIQGQVILDPFAGEGSSTLAALKLNRKVLAIEKDELHFNYLVNDVKDYWKGVLPKVTFS